MVAVHRLAFIHFYSLIDAKDFYETHKKFDDGKVQVIPASSKKNEAVEHKDGEGDDENMGTGSTATSASTSISRTMASMISKFNTLTRGVKKFELPLRLSPPAPLSSSSSGLLRLSKRQEKQPISSGFGNLQHQQHQHQNLVSTMSSPIIFSFSSHGSTYWQQQQQQQISSTSLYSSSSVQQRPQQSLSSLLSPHPVNFRNIHLSTST